MTSGNPLGWLRWASSAAHVATSMTSQLADTSSPRVINAVVRCEAGDAKVSFGKNVQIVDPTEVFQEARRIAHLKDGGADDAQ